ncbi:MAG: DUF3299 domain-containing protein [Asticcacaulis sp.]
MDEKLDVQTFPAKALLGGFGLGLIVAGQAHGQADSIKAERLRQQNLPHSDDPIWGKLKACKVDFDAVHNAYTLTPTAEVKAMDGTVVTVQGFILPLDGSDHTRHFLTGVNTPVCFYHPPGEPNEIMEVFSVKPVAWKEEAVFMQGRFTVMSAGQAGVFFRLEDASPVEPPSIFSHLPGLGENSLQ